MVPHDGVRFLIYLTKELIISCVRKMKVPGKLCARLSWRVPVGLNPTRVKPNQQPVTQTASVEVTKLMKPVAGSCRAATQVNVVSSEIGS